MNIYPVDNAKGFADTYPLDSDLSFGERWRPFFKQLVIGDFRRLPRPEYEMASCITSSFDSRLEKNNFSLWCFFRTRVKQNTCLLLTLEIRFVATYTPFTPRLKSY